MKTHNRLSGFLFSGALLVASVSIASAQGAPPPPPPPPPEAPAPGSPAPGAQPAPLPPPPGGAVITVCPRGTCGPMARPMIPPPPVRRYPRRTRFYLGVGYAGMLSVIGGQGPFTDTKPGYMVSAYTGLRFGGAWAMELGMMASFHMGGEEPLTSRFEDNVTLWGLTLDMRYFFVPHWHVFEPYLQFGVGVLGLAASRDGGDGISVEHVNAAGGALQAGGGFELNLARWISIGMRVLYRAMILGNPEDSEARCLDTAYRTSSNLHLLTAEFTLQITF